MDRTSIRMLGIAFVLTMMTIGCATTRPVPPTNAADVPEFRPGYISGYLDDNAIPNSRKFLSPPPSKGSEEESRDFVAAKAAFALRDTVRWGIAQQDSNLKFPGIFNTFSCALGFQPSEQATPHLAMLIRRSTIDAGRSSNGAKEAYNRDRPFEVLLQPSCTPQDEERLKKDGSYPSGHAAMGMTWALLLSEIAPKQRNAIMKRGQEFGSSRVVCGAHWPSDVEAGQRVAAATFATLQKNEVFSEQLRLAQHEVSRQQKSPTTAPVNCEFEANALKTELKQ